MSARNAGVVNVGYRRALEDICDQDGDSEHNGEVHRPKNHIANDGGSWLQPKKEEKDGHFNEREDGIVE